LRQATTEQRRTLLAAALGWMLDAFDAMLYALVLTQVSCTIWTSRRRLRACSADSAGIADGQRKF
jgi:hypothetical protein